MGILPVASPSYRVPVTIVRRGKRIGCLVLTFDSPIESGKTFVLSRRFLDQQVFDRSIDDWTRIRPGLYRLNRQAPRNRGMIWRSGRWAAERVMN